MITLITAPSILGLRPSGVELLPDALVQAGLLEQLSIAQTKAVLPPAYSPERDAVTHMLNPNTISTYSISLANAVQQVQKSDSFPLVLGGDCSIILGNMLALKRQGRYGLFFLDGHADFYQPEAETGEAADMDLALVTGRGPAIVTNLENRGPLVKDVDTVQFGQRDRQETIDYGSQQIQETAITVFELKTIRQTGVESAAKAALAKLLQQPIQGFWIHIDADVLADDEMPAVDYRLAGGLSFSELQRILQLLVASNRVVGLDLTVFNPKKDLDGTLAARLVRLLSEVCKPFI